MSTTFSGNKLIISNYLYSYEDLIFKISNSLLPSNINDYIIEFNDVTFLNIDFEDIIGLFSKAELLIFNSCNFINPKSIIENKYKNIILNNCSYNNIKTEFAKCEKLESINIPMNIYNTNSNNSFKYCYSLENTN